LAAFWRVTFPLSLPAVGAGISLCFIPMVGEFVIPDLLGGSDTLMIGKTIWTDFFANRDWPSASAAAIVMLAILVIPIVIYQRWQARAAEAVL
jgi:putrescine transport system permease protein